MTKRSRPRRPLSAAARSRGRYALMVIGVTMASVTGLLLAAWWFGRQGQPAPEDHPHVPGAHGGALVSVGEGDRHYHAEAVVGKQGFLSIYTYGDDAATVREIESQLVTARVRVRGESDAIAIDLLPIPQPGDGLGKTSRFGGKLPRALRGFPVEVIVPEIAIDGKPFRLEFPPPAVQNSDREPTGDEPERLPLTPGGKYTAADVTANSNVRRSPRNIRVSALPTNSSPAPGTESVRSRGRGPTRPLPGRSRAKCTCSAARPVSRSSLGPPGTTLTRLRTPATMFSPDGVCGRTLSVRRLGSVSFAPRRGEFSCLQKCSAASSLCSA